MHDYERRVNATNRLQTTLANTHFDDTPNLGQSFKLIQKGHRRDRDNCRSIWELRHLSLHSKPAKNSKYSSVWNLSSLSRLERVIAREEERKGSRQSL